MKEKDPDVFVYLITHKAFRDWVLKPGGEDDQFWKMWMEEHADKILEIKKAIEFIERMRFEKSRLSAHELDNMLGNVIANDKPGYNPVVQDRSKIRWLLNPWFQAAAALLAFIISALLIADFAVDEPKTIAGIETRWITVENRKGQKCKIELPDGTEVHLSYESKLKYPEVFGKDIREVELIGEAFFDVVPIDTIPFVVKTDAIETEVLGTSFNVRSYQGDFETDVSLVSGKVKVREIDGGFFKKTEYLSPGEQLVYQQNSGEMTISNFDIEKVTGWKEGLLIFEDASLVEFIARLEKWYGVDFQVYGDVPAKWRVNGRYQNEKLDDILIGLKFIYGLEYKKQGNNVILKLK